MTSNTPDYPEYQFIPSIVTSNGETLARQYKTGDGTIVTDISLSKDTVDRKNKLKNLLDDYESQLNVFLPELTTQFENIATAKKKAALDSFESIYEPTVRKSREDYFSRLGTLDSTAYLDRYNDLEKTKQQAYKDIANDYVANLDELKNDELTRRYNYLSYLQSGLNDINNQSNNYISSVSNLSSNYTNSYNNYLNKYYNAQSNSGSSFTDSAGTWASIAGTIASIWA